ncbi:hypothetical protein ACB092_05G256000 [Castanea dentata]
MDLGRAILFSIMVLCGLVLYCQTALAEEFLVGGPEGWNENISNWPPNGTTFHAGDVLEFVYDPRVYNVVVVDKLGYETCKAPLGALENDSGNDQVYLEKGANYFICTKRGCCEKNMKIVIIAE